MFPSDSRPKILRETVQEVTSLHEREDFAKEFLQELSGNAYANGNEELAQRCRAAYLCMLGRSELSPSLPTAGKSRL